MTIPFLDLKAQYDSIREDVHAAMQEVLDRCAFAGGPFVERFEDEFAAFCQCRHAIGMGNGTDALWLALLGLGVGPGDEVITVPNTFIATAEAISLTGATPVFVDIEEASYTMNPALIEEAITARTKAIIPVHLYGQMADMDPIMHIARARGLFVVEDACQAHGARYKGHPAGSMGDVGCFSFYPGKNLGAFGEAGMAVTNNTELADRMRVFRDHGQERKYHHKAIGWNARMDGLQGAVLGVKLKHLDHWNEQRRNHAANYAALLPQSTDLVIPRECSGMKHVWHIYAVRAKNRDGLMGSLTERGIQCGIHYPVPIHLQDAYRHLQLGRGSFPVAERVSDELLSLPMYPELTTSQIRLIAEAVKSLL